MDHFYIETSGNTTAGNNIVLVVIAYDAYGNTLTAVPGNTNLQVLENGTAPLDSDYSAWVCLTPPLTSAEFGGDGNYLGIIQFNKAGSYVFRIINSVIGNTDSLSFTIYPSTPAQYLILMTGHSFQPGELRGGIWGRSGSPDPVQSGSPFAVTIAATDQYGNPVFYSSTIPWDHTYLLFSDLLAIMQPNPVSVVAGHAFPFFTLYQPTDTQVIHLPAGPLTPINSGSFMVMSAPPTLTSTPTIIPVTHTATPSLPDMGDFRLKVFNNLLRPITSAEPALIAFRLNNPQGVTVKIFTHRGRLAAVLADNQQYPAGLNQLEWNARDDTGQLVPSGIYIVFVHTAKWEDYARIAVVK
ncbi:hypothetical protein JW933_01165 [candidate division FCPU426 bacterium]|nr:hypothetical protein [candidate division FCPU426 bacterium]